MNVDQTEAGAADMCCASCGKSELDDIKLKNCDDCDLVKYCSDQCQHDHLPQHEAMCKKRAADLRDEKLFKQPESSFMGDCPICFLPLDHQKSLMQSCCNKIVCRGCSYANKVREIEARLQPTCPFCRRLIPKSKEEANVSLKKRVEKNDPVAIREIGKKHYQKGDYERAFHYLTKAAELGDVDAQNDLSFCYRKGEGVEKDEKKGLYYLEEAAIAGLPEARYNLAMLEGKNERFDRAVKHWIIAANLGYDDSIQRLKESYKDGLVSKEDFAGALRAHQAAIDASKSPQREAAEKYLAKNAHRIIYN